MERVGSILLIVASLLGCKNDGIDPIPYLEENDGSIVLISNQSITTFDLSSNDEEFVSFDLDINPQVRSAVSSVLIQMVFTDQFELLPGYLNNQDSVYEVVEIIEITTFPTTVTLSIDDILTKISNFNWVTDFFVGDVVDLYFQVNTTDGRVLTNSSELDLCQQQSDENSIKNCKVSVNFDCPFIITDVDFTYTLVEDGFPASLSPDEPIIAVAGPGENEITFVDVFKHSEKYNITVNVDPDTYMISVENQIAFDTGEFNGVDAGLAKLRGNGFFSACTGEVILYLKGSASNPDTGIFADWGFHRYILQKTDP